jgi:hypothetical protein
MNDRPTALELIAAARMHLEKEVIPALVEPRLRFQTLVAANVLLVVEREFAVAEAQLEAEWERLNTLEQTSAAMPLSLEARRSALTARERALCQRLQRGEFDEAEARRALFQHLRCTVEDKLRVASPRFLARASGEKTE